MKRKDLIKRLEEMGCIFIRHGGKHDWYQIQQLVYHSPSHDTTR